MSPSNTGFGGVRVQVSPHAVKIEYRVEPWPTKKRRRNWTVRKHSVPCAFRLYDGTLVVHPTIYAQLKMQVK